MEKELQSIFENVDKDILNEDTLKAITDLVEETVNKKVNERVTLEVESALQSMDEDHSARFQQAIEAIDNDHTEKVKKVVEHINKDHIAKLMQIKEKYESLLQKTAVEHRDTLVESVSNYLDRYIEKSIPKEQIVEAAKNRYIENVLNEARQVLSVDSKVINENVKSAIRDGKEKLDRLTHENAQLKKKMVVTESQRILAEKTANLPMEQARFVRTRLQNKSPEFIKENFQYVLDMFVRSDKQERRSALNENKTTNVDRKRVADEIIKENVKNELSMGSESDNPLESIYMEGLNFRK